MSNAVTCPRCRRSIPATGDVANAEPLCPECGPLPNPRVPPIEPVPPSAAAPSGVTALPPSSRGAIDAYQDGGSARIQRRRRRALGDDLDEAAPRFSIAMIRPTAGIATAAMILLGIGIALDVAILGGDAMQLHLAGRLLAGEQVPQPELVSNDSRQQALAILYLLCYAATGVVFLVWFYRAYANLAPLGARHLKQTPGWAVGVWFLPILNFYRPVQVAQEIWRNSDPAAVDDDNDDLDSGDSPNSTLVGFWWAAWLVDMVVNRISSQMSLKIESPSTLKYATIADMWSQGTGILAATLAIAVVHAIQNRQRTRAEALEARFDRPG
jgi:hypothetical protein